LAGLQKSSWSQPTKSRAMCWRLVGWAQRTEEGPDWFWQATTTRLGRPIMRFLLARRRRAASAPLRPPFRICLVHDLTCATGARVGAADPLRLCPARVKGFWKSGFRARMSDLKRCAPSSHGLEQLSQPALLLNPSTRLTAVGQRSSRKITCLLSPSIPSAFPPTPFLPVLLRQPCTGRRTETY
jgi:hypothetical protein